MPHVLLVDADPSRSAAERSALAMAGHDVTVAPSGGFALTMLERARPDVIVSWLQVEDMYAHELCAIVRSDPMTRAIPFILLTDRCPSTPEAVVRTVADIPPLEDVSTPVHGDNGSSDRGSKADIDDHEPVGAVAISATSEVLETTELQEAFQTVSAGKKTGRLVACLGAAEGALIFKAGRLVRAEFQGQRGELALTSLLVAASDSPSGRYRFFPWDGSEVPRYAWTVDHEAEEFLQRIWTEVDESTTTPTPQGHTPAAGEGDARQAGA
jgi:CheY-like chemotaxis protein